MDKIEKLKKNGLDFLPLFSLSLTYIFAFKSAISSLAAINSCLMTAFSSWSSEQIDFFLEDVPSLLLCTWYGSKSKTVPVI